MRSDGEVLNLIKENPGTRLGGICLMLGWLDHHEVAKVLRRLRRHGKIVYEWAGKSTGWYAATQEKRCEWCGRTRQLEFLVSTWQGYSCRDEDACSDYVRSSKTAAL